MYSYYTDDEEDEGNSEDTDATTEDELESYYRVRAFFALMFPLSISVGLGIFLRHKVDSR